MGYDLINKSLLQRFKYNLDNMFANITTQLNNKVNSTDYASGFSYGVVKVDGDTIISNNGVISSVAGGLSYSMEKQNTNRKWLDGNYIYQVTFTVPKVQCASGYWTPLVEMPEDLTLLIDGVVHNVTDNKVIKASLMIGVNPEAKKMIYLCTDISCVVEYLTIQYTSTNAPANISTIDWTNANKYTWDDLSETTWE